MHMIHTKCGTMGIGNINGWFCGLHSYWECRVKMENLLYNLVYRLVYVIPPTCFICHCLYFSVIMSFDPLDPAEAILAKLGQGNSKQPLFTYFRMSFTLSVCLRPFANAQLPPLEQQYSSESVDMAKVIQHPCDHSRLIAYSAAAALWEFIIDAASTSNTNMHLVYYHCWGNSGGLWAIYKQWTFIIDCRPVGELGS